MNRKARLQEKAEEAARLALRAVLEFEKAEHDEDAAAFALFEATEHAAVARKWREAAERAVKSTHAAALKAARIADHNAR